MDGLEELGVEVGHFLPDFLAIECRFVDAGVLCLDLCDDSRDDAESASLCDFFGCGQSGGLVVGLSAYSDGCTSTLEGSELEVSYFAGYR